MDQNEVIADVNRLSHRADGFTEALGGLQLDVLHAEVGLLADPVRVSDAVNLLLEHLGVFRGYDNDLCDSIDGEELKLEENKRDVRQREETLGLLVGHRLKLVGK